MSPQLEKGDIVITSSGRTGLILDVHMDNSMDLLMYSVLIEDDVFVLDPTELRKIC